MYPQHTRMALAMVSAWAAFAASPNARAQGVASDQALSPVIISGSRSALDPNLPSTTASITRQELRRQNLFNPEDALKYFPDMTVRKRYIGDRNALIGGRSFTSTQAARGLVYMDGYLLSNFLGRFDAPRWNMVAPEEIERVDALYGPYSALYPGNSIGTTVALTTRMPKHAEANARLTSATQQFEAYGHGDNYSSRQLSALIGDRTAAGVSYSLGLNRQESTSQPMQYFAVSANAAGVFPKLSALDAKKTALAVGGVEYDLDPKGFKRAIFGAGSGAIDHTIQDHAKLRLAYDFTPTLRADGFVGYWTNDTKNRNDSFLRDGTGKTVWSGVVGNGGNLFAIPVTAFAPSSREEEHVQYGVTLKTSNPSGWNASIVLSKYAILKDAAYQAGSPEPAAAAATGGAGNVASRDGTNWLTFEAQATYRPTAGDFGGGRHALTFGVHRNAYRLANVVVDVPDWRADAAAAVLANGGGTANQAYYGNTGLTALYAQDAWRFDPKWVATIGLRVERWQAFDGAQMFAGIKPVNYASRSIDAASPKLSLSYRPDDDWLWRASVGHGVRFPTVVELFQGGKTASSIIVNDPDLQPEKSTAAELTLEKNWQSQQARVSIFQEDIRDTIFNQINTAVVPNVTNTQNVQRVRARGIELVWSGQDIGVRGLNLDLNVSYAQVKTLESNYLESIGKNWSRVPRLRANAMAAYRFNPQWFGSVALRYSGRQYNELDNSDINPNTFGAVSSFCIADLRVAYQASKRVELALGIDNLANQRTFAFHPLPGRSVFTELRAAY